MVGVFVPSNEGKPRLYLFFGGWFISPHPLAREHLPPHSPSCEGHAPRGRGGRGGGTEAQLTFPVDLTPFQMQKKQTNHTNRRQRARSHFSEPGLLIPEDKLSTLRLEANRTAGQVGPRSGIQILDHVLLCTGHVSSPGPGMPGK